MSPLPAHLRKRAKAKSPFDGAVLGVYRGPARLDEPPKRTDYQLRLLTSIKAGEVKLGQGQYVNHWRWHHGGASVTVTKHVNRLIQCGWVKVVGSHAELTPAGETALSQP